MALCAVCGGAAGGGGWLGRAVAFQRGLFLDDVREVAPVQIQLSVERGGAGYRDSGAWDYSAVARLLALVGASAPAPQRRALRRALRPRLSEHTRRFISKQDSWKLFPPLNKDNANEIYYDSESTVEEDGAGVAAVAGGGGAREELDDDAVVVLRNPVEARLPSAQISIRLLREILEARALAARAMPGTTRSTITWVPMNKSSAQGGAEAGNATSSDSGTAGEGNGTTDAAGGGGMDGAGGAATGAATDAGAGGQTGAAAGGDTPAGAAAATEAAVAPKLLKKVLDGDGAAGGKGRPPRKPADADMPENSRGRRSGSTVTVKAAAASTRARGKAVVERTPAKAKVTAAKTAAKGKVAAARMRARAKG